MHTLILADVHLKASPDGEAAKAEFVRFLRAVDTRRFDRIVVLGDLFDFWFEYRHAVFSGYFDVLCAFADLAGQGVEMHLVCGNHDFWAGAFLEQSLHFTIHREPYTCRMGDKNVLFAHGDGLNPKDYGYRIYKRIARSPLIIWLFGRLHPDRAMAIAQWVSSRSRARRAPAQPAEGHEVEPLRRFAKAAIEGGQADVVVCGHSHYPQEETFAGGLYLNAGDWVHHRSYVEWDGSAFKLKRYDPEAWAQDNEGLRLERFKEL